MMFTITCVLIDHLAVIGLPLLSAILKVVQWGGENFWFCILKFQWNFR